MLENFLEELNISQMCARYRVSLWACPHFLFLVMGIIIIISILSTYVAAQRYTTPEITIIIVPGITAILFTISHIIIRSFEQMAEVAQSKAEFVSIASHQLRSPLTSMKWQLEVLLNEPTSPEMKEHLETINNQNTTMLRLVNDLLVVNRIDNDQLSLTLQAISLPELTTKTVDMHRDAAATARIMVAVEDIPADIPAVVGDEVYTRWVLQNLTDNAIRYSYPNTTVTISLSKEKEGMRWQITNTGISIPDEDKHHVFEKFFRARTSMKWQTEGSGLGLYVAKAIVKGSGGDIGFITKPDEHTTFWFSLPFASKEMLSKVKKRNITL